MRNTTWTSTRDGAEGPAFVTTTFYDGQAMMVPAASGVTSIDALAGAAICLTAGTTTEQNLADRMAGIQHTPQTFDEPSQVQEAFLAGTCDAWTSDRSQLAGLRSTWPADQGGPAALTILDETFSKEPLGPAVVVPAPDPLTQSSPPSTVREKSRTSAAGGDAPAVPRW